MQYSRKSTLAARSRLATSGEVGSRGLFRVLASGSTGGALSGGYEFLRDRHHPLSGLPGLSRAPPACRPESRERISPFCRRLWSQLVLHRRHEFPAAQDSLAQLRILFACVPGRHGEIGNVGHAGPNDGALAVDVVTGQAIGAKNLHRGQAGRGRRAERAWAPAPTSLTAKRADVDGQAQESGPDSTGNGTSASTAHRRIRCDW